MFNVNMFVKWYIPYICKIRCDWNWVANTQEVGGCRRRGLHVLNCGHWGHFLSDSTTDLLLCWQRPSTQNLLIQRLKFCFHLWVTLQLNVYPFQSAKSAPYLSRWYSGSICPDLTKCPAKLIAADIRRHFHQWHFLSTTNSALSGRTFEEGQFPDEYQFGKHGDVQLSVAAKYLQKSQLKWKRAYASDGLGLRLGLGLGRAYFDLEFVCSAGKQPMMRLWVNDCVRICLCCLYDPLSD